MSDKQLYNSKIINNYVKYIRKEYGHIDVNELLRHANMRPYEVADENHWFSQEQINRFHEKLSQLAQDEDIAKAAGRFGASPEGGTGVVRQYLLGFVTPAAAYAVVGKASKNWTRATTFQHKKISSKKIEMIVTPKEGVSEKPFQCSNRIGSLEAVAMLFQNKVPKVEHPECIHHGGKSCRYIFSFETTTSVLLKKIRNYLILTIAPACIVASVINLSLATSTIIPISVIAILFLSIVAGNQEIAELKNSLNSSKHSTDKLLEQMEVNYNNAFLTHEIGVAISEQAKSGDILSNIVRIFKKRLNYDRCMILLADKDQKRLLFRAGYGYSESQVKYLNQTSFHLDKKNSKGVFIICFKQQKPFLVNDIREIKQDLSLRSHSFANKLGSQAFICCPIISDGEPIGVLAVDNLRSKKPLVQNDMNLLIGLASTLGVSIKNAELHFERERQFRSILQTLAASIDARDPMTSGHSTRVTKYALGICDELQLDNEFKEMIRVAALLHDYGKIGVPDNILKKQGRLTKEEYEIVKTHAEKTKRILKQITFDGLLNQVPDIAGSHHEKMDGSGYPEGLVGEQIPLGARIIAVADFFEAITARRHYRGPMPLRDAFKLLHAESKKRFDINVVNAFMRYYKKTHAGEPEYRELLRNVS